MYHCERQLGKSRVRTPPYFQGTRKVRSDKITEKSNWKNLVRHACLDTIWRISWWRWILDTRAVWWLCYLNHPLNVSDNGSTALVKFFLLPSSIYFLSFFLAFPHYIRATPEGMEPFFPHGEKIFSLEPESWVPLVECDGNKSSLVWIYSNK